ncbi:hypothetical protein O3P69_008309 [Scylla paramamosain]|uniref:Uncharacterized protein n=1 Tax=Scylla paramamosain TaxID=85552 RepID=A0AAW0SK40_SCYPA
MVVVVAIMFVIGFITVVMKPSTLVSAALPNPHPDTPRHTSGLNIHSLSQRTAFQSVGVRRPGRGREAGTMMGGVDSVAPAHALEDGPDVP